MPEKNPDVWAQIWMFLQVTIGVESLRSALAALIISALRIAFMRKRPAFRYRLLDAAMCASIAGVSVPVCSHLFGHNDFSPFIGTMIGFIGAEKIRDFLFRFINTKVTQQNYSDYPSYDNQRGRVDDENQQ